MNQQRFARYSFLRCIGTWVVVLLVHSSYGQQTDSVHVPSPQVAPRTDSSADVWDVYYRFINKKGHRAAESQAAGFQPFVYPEIAYSLQTGFAVGINANLSFTSTSPTQNISTIVSTPQYTQYKQVIIPVVANIWTKGDRYNILGDWRYFDYSADNYGLGGNSSPAVDDRLTYSFLRLYQSVLRQVTPNFSVGLGTRSITTGIFRK